MPQHHSDPRRESDATALPDVETFTAIILRCPVCDMEYPETDRGGSDYRNTDRETTCCHGKPLIEGGYGWFYWFCFPGCLPSTDPVGPFYSEALALADAREGMESDNN